MTSSPKPSGELGPDGKEWAKTEAGYKHVESMMPRADGESRAPYWHGWALREAFVAGAEWQEARAGNAAAQMQRSRSELWDLITEYSRMCELGNDTDIAIAHRAIDAYFERPGDNEEVVYFWI